MVQVEAAVIGAGPAGLTAAIALASAGIETALIAPKAPADHRTTALMMGSVAALETLGVWAHCAAQAAPLRSLRIVDDTGRLLRAPETCFESSEIGLPAFGYNVENRHLVAALEARAADLPGLRRIEQEVLGVETADRATATLKDGARVSARLVVGADGHRSTCRAAAGIGIRSLRYNQHALTFNLRHARPHRDISTEFQTASGPFTVVPLPGDRSSIVCVADPATAGRLAAAVDEMLAREAERRMHSILGKVTLEPGRGHFPLSGETAQLFAARRIALVGEAAHRFPPIGAQGLNLGLRDAATVAELAADAHRSGSDIGHEGLLSRYDRMRRLDVESRSLAVDLLNRTLLSDFLPVQGARGLGLFLLNRVGPLRRLVMREGIAPMVAQPRLMRGEALV
ncbi:MAG: UbiH/UbiF family hydroxylase [Pseudorhodoplanes sp.]|nr:UbiH/UbiF family hydroxylase [Pseudorhodoplanes sp.]